MGKAETFIKYKVGNTWGVLPTGLIRSPSRIQTLKTKVPWGHSLYTLQKFQGESASQQIGMETWVASESPHPPCSRGFSWEVRPDSASPVLVLAEFVIKLFVYNSSSTLANQKQLYSCSHLYEQNKSISKVSGVWAGQANTVQSRIKAFCNWPDTDGGRVDSSWRQQESELKIRKFFGSFIDTIVKWYCIFNVNYCSKR